MMPQNVYLNRYYERGESRPEEHITLLTDRALYRPGQTVYVKGIAYEQEADKARFGREELSGTFVGRQQERTGTEECKYQ